MKKKNAALIGLTAGVTAGYLYRSLDDLKKQKIKRHFRKYKYYYIAGGVGATTGLIVGVKYYQHGVAKLTSAGNLTELSDDAMAIVTDPHKNFYAFGKDADVRVLMHEKQADAYNRVTEAFMHATVGKTPEQIATMRFDAEKADVDIFNRVGKLINGAVAKMGPVHMGTDYDYLMEV